MIDMYYLHINIQLERLVQIMLQYVAPALGVIVLVITLFNMIKALIRGFKKSLGSLIAIAAAAIVSAIVTLIVCNPDSGFIATAESALMGIIPADGIGEILAVEELGTALSYYVCMLLGPFFFLACYILLSIIFSIVMAIVVKFIPLFNNSGEVLKRLGGLGIGVVCGLLVSLFVLSPVVGLLSIANGFTSSMEMDAEEREELGEMDLSIFENTGFLLVFDAFSSADLDGERVYLRSEATALLGLVESLESMGGDLGDMNSEQIASLRKLLVTIDGSTLLKNTLAGVFSEAAEKWTSGEEFLGISSFDAGELLNPVINEMLLVFKTTNKDYIISDLTAMVDIFEVVINSGLANDTDFQTMLTKLGDGVISDLLVATSTNARMVPVADEITKLSVKALASTLGVPANADERYNSLMNDVAGALNDTYGMEAGERFVTVKDEIGDDFDHYGVNIEGLALDHATEGIINDLGAVPDVSGDDVKEFFVVYSLGAVGSDSQMSVSGGLVMLGANNNGLKVNGDGTVSVNGVVLKRYNASNIYSSKAYVMGAEGVDIGGSASLTDAEHMESTMLTLEELYSFITLYNDCTNAELEAKKVGEIFAELAKTFDGLDIDNLKFSDVMVKMGNVFDLMKASEIFGAETTKAFLQMILQSKSLSGAIGLSHTERLDFVEKISGYADGKEGGYADATGVVSGTLEAIDKASDKNATREEKKQASQNMINSINHDNKEMVTSMVTSNMVNDFGVGVDNTDSVSDSFKSLIENMASYKDGDPDEESLSAEAHAVSKILSLATTGAGDGPMFDKDGIEGSVDSSSDEFIKTMVESQVVMDTIAQTVDGKEHGSNPYGISYDTEEEREDVANSLEQYYVDNVDSGDEELEEKLYDLALVMNVDIDLDQYKNA